MISQAYITLPKDTLTELHHADSDTEVLIRSDVAGIFIGNKNLTLGEGLQLTSNSYVRIKMKKDDYIFAITNDIASVEVLVQSEG